MKFPNYRQLDAMNFEPTCFRMIPNITVQVSSWHQYLSGVNRKLIIKAKCLVYLYRGILKTRYFSKIIF